MSKLFDPSSLMNSELESNATRMDPLPMGEVVAQITEINFKSGTSQKTGNDWARLDASLQIDDPAYLAGFGDGKSTLARTNLGVMLDLAQSGEVATGPNKNVRLGRLREAAGVNGKPLSALVGQFIKVRIDHKPHPTEAGVIMAEVGGYTKP